jgi:hypothetical protein
MAVKPRNVLKPPQYVSRIIQARLLSALSAASSYVYLRGDNPQLEAEKNPRMEYDALSRAPIGTQTTGLGATHRPKSAVPAKISFQPKLGVRWEKLMMTDG